jgi:ribosomal protein S18 acetylase RimI-like enzyme
MENDLTHVLYSSETNEPLAWIFHDEAGSFTHLYCLEDHRKKGYAEYVTIVATNAFLEKGKNVLAYTLEGNVKAQKLFDKLGFDFIEHVWWIELKKENINKIKE